MAAVQYTAVARVDPDSSSRDDTNNSKDDARSQKELVEDSINEEATRTPLHVLEIEEPKQESTPPRFWGSCRCTCVIVCWFANIVCYVDRINISIAIISMAEEMNWTESQQGYVLSAFFYGYMCTQIAGGKLAQKHGSSLILQASVLLWSLFTLLTPIAARTSLGFLYFVRIGMGFGEGATLPCIHAALSRWIPLQERTRSVAFVTSGQLVGTLLALASSPAVAYSWSMVFYVFGGLGFVWVLAARCLFVSFPEQHPRITAHELAYIIKNRDEQDEGYADEMHNKKHTPEIHRSISSRNKLRAASFTRRRLSWTNWSLCGLCCVDDSKPPRPIPVWYSLIVQRPILAAIAALAAHNWGWYVMLGWMPKYLKHLGADKAVVGLYALLPYMLMFLVGLSWGWYLDRWILRGLPLVGARKLSQTLSMGTPAVALTVLVMLPFDPSLGVSLFFLTLAVTMSSCTHSGVWANVIDIAPNHAGYLLGIVNTVATIPGMLGNSSTGWILDATGSWSGVFAVAVAVYVVGLVAYIIWGQAQVLYV